MYNVRLMEIVQPVEDLDNVIGSETFIELAKRLQSLLKRSVLGELENDTEGGRRISRHALVLDDVGMRESLDEVDLARELLYLVLAEVLEPNALDGDYLTRVEVQGAIDRTELVTAYTIAELLYH
jgi:hypothetical protein